MVEVRPLRAIDRDAWQPLWEGYLAFYRKDLDPAVTDDVFRRLSREAQGMFGLLAVDRGTAVGLAHAVLHPSTWSVARYCYLEDLFAAPSARGAGAARALVEAVYTRADATGADRVYWHTQQDNTAAQALYNQLAHRTTLVTYER